MRDMFMLLSMGNKDFSLSFNFLPHLQNRSKGTWIRSLWKIKMIFLRCLWAVATNLKIILIVHYYSRNVSWVLSHQWTERLIHVVKGNALPYYLLLADLLNRTQLNLHRLCSSTYAAGMVCLSLVLSDSFELWASFSYFYNWWQELQ